jgi:hypothetical protein
MGSNKEKVLQLKKEFGDCETQFDFDIDIVRKGLDQGIKPTNESKLAATRMREAFNKMRSLSREIADFATQGSCALDKKEDSAYYSERCALWSDAENNFWHIFDNFKVFTYGVIRVLDKASGANGEDELNSLCLGIMGINLEHHLSELITFHKKLSDLL